MKNILQPSYAFPDIPVEQEWRDWFAVPGDMDDFIYYWEDQGFQSEK